MCHWVVAQPGTPPQVASQGLCSVLEDEKGRVVEIVPETPFSVARFFVLQHTKPGKNIPNYSKWPKIDQMAKKYQHLLLEVPPKFTQICILV
jgi:hypothetical protein